jgi:5-methylcytosine-specific restriction endonuclease McrA
MSAEKKAIREAFRSAVFKRDNHKCRGCGVTSTQWSKAHGGYITGNSFLDAHHITDRNEMPNGGYVKENGISLCPDCHEKAEVFHSTGTALPNFSPADLYTLIESSVELATIASEKLKR